MNNTQHIKIGILAGMGPKSTSPFLDLVIEQCQKQYGAFHDIDFPHIIIYSLPTPFYIHQKIDHKNMEFSIIEGLQKLESIGVDFISMPCNTAHKYFETLKNCIKIPLLNIVDATVKCLEKESKKVTLFATRETVDAKIYQLTLQQANIELILKEEWQQEVDHLIQGVKYGENQGKLSLIIERLSTYLHDEHIDTIIIACTDITSIKKTMTDFTIIDSSEALAEETIRMYLECRR